ncbi:type II toxin-antitoxin system prevent-host-death family antitoxin [Aphanothece sacrum]|uniref:Antitoxin PHD n=1 Tax=Aphanothece sacrum FPU1 TaxID=1920663 RepID=A0A401IEC6_APHSA|nr:type II toxin-antitoxin system prevent-host-death family antitoxin [Aphanothece sacrum]GBF79627.1 antitoxin PHD [Aphanothece sacrum FPU1]GBF87087.1 antitoxin PHD [Aphanothece sacrum FPU3]
MIKVNETVNSDELLALVKKAEIEGERIIIEKEGQGKVAIINYADLEYLEALEDARDSELLRQAVEESKGQPSVTFDELLEELGLNIEDLTSGDEDE